MKYGMNLLLWTTHVTAEHFPLFAKLKKADISRTEPMTVSLMPPGLDKALSKEQLRDLMTYLLTEPTHPSTPSSKPNE